MSGPPTPLRRNPAAASRELASEGGAVVLHVETVDYYGLNRIGAMIWELIDGARTEEAVVDELAPYVEAAPARLTRDVARFVARLRERDLVQ